MDGTEGLVRGNVCTDSGSSIRIPVGPTTLGRIMNVIGESVDERGPIESDTYVVGRRGGGGGCECGDDVNGTRVSDHL